MEKKMKIEQEKIIHSSLKCEYDVRVKEKAKVYGFILYEYHDEYTDSDKWYLAFVGTYTKFTKPEDRPNITYFGGKPGCEFVSMPIKASSPSFFAIYLNFISYILFSFILQDFGESFNAFRKIS